MMSMEKVVFLWWVISTWVTIIVANPIAWNLGLDTNEYTDFLKELRLKALVNSKVTKHGIPMMPKDVNPPTYILVTLTSIKGNAVTLAMNANDLYVVAYSDTFNNQQRAFFFKDAPSNAKKTLFLSAKQVHTLSYDSNYNSIEKKAQIKSTEDRSKVGLGVQKLSKLIDKVNEEKVIEKEQANFFLIALQTVAEAARFSYIEREIKSRIGVFEFRQNAKVLDLESEWGKISKAVANANANGEFTTGPLKLVNDKGVKYDATKVADVKDDINILGYQKK